jgi:PAS domain S-box-containing protein
MTISMGHTSIAPSVGDTASRAAALPMDSSLLAAVIELAPTAMVMVDAQGNIVLINREAERLFGYERSDLIGQPVEKLVPERYRHAHPAMRNGYLGHPEARRMGVGRELHALRSNGVEVPVEIGLNPIHSDGGTLVLSAIVDISERQRLEVVRRANVELEQRVRERTAELEDQTERLRLSNQALERSNIELQQFAYVASHDLQSPLRSISGFVQLIERRCVDQVDDQAKGWIRSAAEATQRLSTLIRDLLEVSRVDSRAQNFQPVALDEILEDACNLLRETLDDAHTQLESEHLPVVLGDRSQLVQLMQNLIGNAVKYCGSAPPQIHVSARRVAHEWQIRVRDQGIGISPDQHERVFEIFKRLHTQKAYPGTGIGLAVCRRVVTRHGGRIWVESEQGKGSTFVFTLMADEEQMDDHRKTAIRATDTAG